MSFIKLIDESLSDICFATISRHKKGEAKKYLPIKFCCLIFSEKYKTHFSPLLSLYEANKLNKLPVHCEFGMLAGNEKLLTNPK